MIKLIAMDLDGTLLNEKKEVTARTRQALKKAAQHGIETVIATGRPITAIPEELLNMEEFHYVITADGARVEDLKTGELLYEGLIPKELVRDIYDVFDSFDALEEIYIKGQGYVSKWHYEHADDYTSSIWATRYLQNTRKVVDDIHDLFDHDIDKAHALFKSLEDREEAIRRLEQVEGIVLSDAFMINLEVSAAGIDKGLGLRVLGEKLGISTDEMAAFGDSNNDRCMLETAGVSVVMENADQSLKEIADIVAPPNDEDGVAVIIEELLRSQL